MSALVDAVRANTPHSCRASRCGKEGVSTTLEGLPRERVLVDLDCPDLKIERDMQRCDFILADGENRIAAIELKRGNVELSSVARQLTGGAQVAERQLLPDASMKVEFYPVVVYRGRYRRRRGRKPTETVEFRGKPHGIEAIRSGSPLAKALSGR